MAFLFITENFYLLVVLYEALKPITDFRSYLLFSGLIFIRLGFGPHPRPPWGPHGEWGPHPHGGGESTFESPGGGGFGPLTPWGFGGVLHDFLSFQTV